MEITNDQYYLRHSGFFNSESQLATAVVIYGAGSVGSHVAYELCKMGVKEITIVDFDKIEPHNISNQFYAVEQLGESKSSSLKQNLLQFTGSNVEIYEQKLTEEGEFPFSIATDALHIMTFDNIEARKIVFDNLRGFPVTLFDARAGGEGFELFEIQMEDEEDCEYFDGSLQGEFVELKCGEQTVIYNVTCLAAEVCNQFKKWNLRAKRPTYLSRNMNSYKYLAARWVDERDDDGGSV